jgi:NADH-quinone oxidoreductase subunit L
MIKALTLSMVFIPFTVAFAIFMGRFRREAVISNSAILAAISNSVVMLIIAGMWAVKGFGPIDIFFGSLLKVGEYQFDLSFQVDSLTIVLLFLVSFIGGIVTKYSQYYMHREPGYARFFTNILVFLGGMNLLALAGSLDLLFAGWEIVGISSFLLIAFYREREQPSRHALRTYSIYRLCDTGVLLGAWLSHLVWHSSPTFSDLDSPSLMLLLRQTGELPLLCLTALVLLAACGKSAQFPFTFWLPRAMEGPTPSSAVFYGALSIHAGAFLLMRMFPVWQSSHYGQFLVGGVGLVTAVYASLVGRGQSNIKGQIAYASAAQVGLIFLELALGFQSLALFHLAGNALLRCFQLLVSPSIIAFVLRWQGAGGGTRNALERIASTMPRRWVCSLYVFGLMEGYLETGIRNAFWRPVRLVGRKTISMASNEPRRLALIATVLACLPLVFWSRALLGDLLVVLSLVLSASALSYWGKPRVAWDIASTTGVVLAISIALREPDAWVGVAMMTGNNLIGWALGRLALRRMESTGLVFDLAKYRGYVHTDPRGSVYFLMGFLLLAGFPIGPGFLAEDILLHSTVHIGWASTAVLGLAFVINGIALCRIFVRCCFGGEGRTLPAAIAVPSILWMLLPHPAFAAASSSSLKARQGEAVVVTVPTKTKVALKWNGQTPQWWECGKSQCAVLGVGVDVPPGESVIEVFDASQPTSLLHQVHLEVQKTEFGLNRLKVASNLTEPSAEEQKRIQEDKALIEKAYQSGTADSLFLKAFKLPTKTKRTSRFGNRREYNGVLQSIHFGVDYRANEKTPILSINAGKVLIARNLFFAGNMVLIDHGAGIFSSYSHLSRMDVKEGDSVKRGAVIGRGGATGRVTGPHLHWGTRVNGVPVDPTALVQTINLALR